MERHETDDERQNGAGTGTPADTELTRGNLASFFELPTSRGPILVDRGDEAFVRQFNWYAVPNYGGRFYAHARVPKADKRIIMHRVLMDAPAGLVVHHRNNNGLDNRRANLEITTNRKNIKHIFEGRSTGVHFDAAAGKWRVAIRASLGMYDDEARARAIAKALMEKLEAELATLTQGRAPQ